jgi:antitoxin ParD1/3/4
MASSLNISLPASLKSWVEERALSEGYNSADEFVRDVLRREQARARGDDHLIVALESGPARPMDRKDWDRIRAEGKAIARRQKAR